MVRLNVAKNKKFTVNGNELQSFKIRSTTKKIFVIYCKSIVAYIVCIYAHVLLRLSVNKSSNMV